MTDVAKIAASLSEAQRRWLTIKAEFRAPAPGHEKRWMTFPPSNVLRVLALLGLADWVGQIRDPGLAVRDLLQAKREGNT